MGRICSMKLFRSSAAVVEVLEGQVPVEGKGRLRDGRYFTFRARHTQWQMNVGATQEEAEEGEGLVWSEPWGDGPYDAGYMEEDTARGIIESCAVMLLEGVAPPREFVGVPVEEVKVRRFAQMLAMDHCLYGGLEMGEDELEPRRVLAENIAEGRELFQERVPERLHHLYEESLVQIDLWPKGLAVQDVWLTDAASARSVARRWAHAIEQAPRGKRAAMRSDAMRWLMAWTPEGEVRQAWQAVLGN